MRGADHLVFDANFDGADRIVAFEPGEDPIRVEDVSLEAALPGGPVDPARCSLGAATGLDGRFVRLPEDGDASLVWNASDAAAGGVTRLLRLSGGSDVVAQDATALRGRLRPRRPSARALTLVRLTYR